MIQKKSRHFDFFEVLTTFEDHDVFLKARNYYLLKMPKSEFKLVIKSNKMRPR